MILRLLSIWCLALWLQVPATGQTSDIYRSYIDKLNNARQSKDFHQLADSYYQLALYEEEKNRNFERSFEYLARALEYYKVVNDSSGIRDAKYHIARQLLENGMYNDALDELTELKDYYVEAGDKRMLARIELQLFHLYFEKLDVDKARASAVSNTTSCYRNTKSPSNCPTFVTKRAIRSAMWKIWLIALHPGAIYFSKWAISKMRWRTTCAALTT